MNETVKNHMTLDEIEQKARPIIAERATSEDEAARMLNAVKLTHAISVMMSGFDVQTCMTALTMSAAAVIQSGDADEQEIERRAQSMMSAVLDAAMGRLPPSSFPDP